MPKTPIPQDVAAQLIKSPLRQQLLEALASEDASPAMLARRFEQKVNLVAYHVGLLTKGGAAELVRTRPRRGSTEHFYRATVRITVTPTSETSLVIKRNGSVYYRTDAKVDVKPIRRRKRRR